MQALALLSLIEKLKPVINKNSVLPILKAVRLEATNGTLTAIATNLSNDVVNAIACDRELNFKVAITYSLIEGFLKACPQTMELRLEESVNEDGVKRLHLKSETLHYQFVSLNVDEFPDLGEVAPEFQVTGDRALIDAIVSAAKMASRDETKQVLTGVSVAVTQGVAVVRATDGWVMSEQRIPAAGDDCQFVVNQDLIKILSATKGDALLLQVGAESLLATVGETVIRSRLLVGEYPSFDGMVQPTSDSVVVDRRSLQNAIKRCAGAKTKKEPDANLLWVYGDFQQQCLWVEGNNGKEALPAQVGFALEASYVAADLLASVLAPIKSAKCSLQLGRGVLTKVMPEDNTGAAFGLAGLNVSVEMPYAQSSDGTVVTRKVSWEDEQGQTQVMEPAIALPYQYKDGALTVISSLDKAYWEFRNGTGRWLTCKFAPAESINQQTGEAEMANLTLAKVQAEAAIYDVVVAKEGRQYVLHTPDGVAIAYQGKCPAKFGNLQEVLNALPRLDSQEELTEDEVIDEVHEPEIAVNNVVPFEAESRQADYDWAISVAEVNLISDTLEQEFCAIAAAKARMPQPISKTSTAVLSKPKTKKLVNYPAQQTLLPVGAGTKTARMIDLLARSEGVSMQELLEEINPNEASVRVYFGYDLKRKGYGVQEDGATGNFHLVLPDGVAAPLPHTEKAAKR